MSLQPETLSERFLRLWLLSDTEADLNAGAEPGAGRDRLEIQPRTVRPGCFLWPRGRTAVSTLQRKETTR